MNSTITDSPFYYRVRPPVSQAVISEVLKNEVEPRKTNSYYFNSMRIGFLLFLELLRAKKKEPLRIGLQVFTCSCMRRVIEETGNKAIFHDINRHYLSSSPEDIPYDEIDVLVLTHVFGIPNPHYEQIAMECRKKGVYLFEDLASTIDTKVNGVSVGSLSDGFAFSYGFDKPISSYKGGELVINNQELKQLADEKYKLMPEESDKNSRKDLKRLLNYYYLTDPELVERETHTTNLIEPFLYVNGTKSGKTWNKAYQSRLNMKAAVLIRREKMKSLKMSKRKIYLIQQMQHKFSHILKERDTIGKEVIIALKTKYPELIVPEFKSDCQTTLHRPIVIAENPKLRKELENHPNIQFGAYNWNHLITREPQKYPVAHYISRNLINIPNWDKGILQYI